MWTDRKKAASPVQRFVTSAALALLALLPTQGQARMVHDFDCTFCHLEYSDQEKPYMTYNVCLDCHYPGNEGTTYQRSDGSDSNPITATFAAGDGSNALDSNTAPSAETSHFFAGSSDNVPAAGATPPTNFRFNLGWANGQITCSRCHNPHGDTNNPKLLKLGAGTADEMCLDCHSSWNQSGNRGRATHPLVANYATTAAAAPDKYHATPQLNNQSEIQLIDGGLSCSSCHGVHFVDSDATTADGVANHGSLNSGDGKLLRGNGAGRSNASSLCQTCHTYAPHGSSETEDVGCLVCHSGHSYDPAAPNYFVLRRATSTTALGAVADLDYSDPGVLDGAQRYTFWNDQTDVTATGYCEKCHGDAQTIGTGAGQYHVTTAVCTDCHAHGQEQGAFAAACNSCHGFPPGALVTIPDVTGSTIAGAHAAHVEDLGIACAACHYASVGSGPTHLNGDIKITIGFAPDAIPTHGGAYDGQTTAEYDRTVTTPETTVTNSGSKLCSNLYCHGNYSGSGKNASPKWDDATTAACGSCHGGSNSDLPTSGNHGVHASASGFNIPCTSCHQGVISGSGSYAIADQEKHVNGKVDWAFDATESRLKGDAELYTLASGSLQPSDGTTPRAYGRCENIYCHSNAQPDGGTGNPDSYAQPVWGTTNTLNCGSCHQGGVHGDTGPAIDSGSHTAHLDYPLHPIGEIECTVCHRWNTDPHTSGFGCNNCHIAHGGDFLGPLFSNHVDGEVTIAFEPTFGTAASYNGTALPGDGYASCDNTYCHSVGDDSVTNTQLPEVYNNSRYAQPTWGGGTLACNACHGRGTSNGAPDYTNGGSGSESANAHPAHVADNEIGCEKCHYDTTNDGTSITSKTLHINQNNTDISFSSLNPDGSYAADKSCSNTYCHSDGTTVSTGFYVHDVPVNDSPKWDGSTPDPQGDGVLCNNCHGYYTAETNVTDGPAYANYSPKANSHDKHSYSWLGCQDCHYTTTTDGTTITNFANHLNGVYDVSPSPTFNRPPVSGANTFDYTFDPGGGTCDSISCHAGLIAADKTWGNSSMSTNFFYGFQGCYEVTFTESNTSCTPASACTEPYSYIWDFGDGTVINGSSSETHAYDSQGSWTVTLTTISGSGLSGSKSQNISITNTQVFNNNIKPTYDDPPGPVSVSVDGMTVTITDLHTDPDFDCYTAEYGDGLVKIDWGPGGYVDYPADLSAAPSNQQFSYTYATPGTYTVRYGIQDNVMTYPDFIPNFSVTVPQ